MSNDWLPRSRTGVLAFAFNWNTIFQASGTAWNIPTADRTELISLTAEAEVILAKVKSAERTAADTVACNTAFSALEAKLRYINDRYLKIPPLTLENFAQLGKKSPDHIPTPVPAPDVQPEITVTPMDQRQMKLRVIPRPGVHIADERTIVTHEIALGIRGKSGLTLGKEWEVNLGQDEEKPATAEQLPMRITTRRKLTEVVFPQGTNGCEVFIAARFINGKKDGDGPWCEILTRIVP